MEHGNYANGEPANMANGTFGFRTDREGGVKVEGLSSVQRQLRKLADDVDYQAAEFLSVNKAIAAAVAGDSKKFVPVLSGNLAASIREAATKKSAKVKAGGGRGSSGVPYAGPIHFGWPARRIKPQPFFYDAIDKRRDEIQKRYEQLVDTLIKKYDLDDKRTK
jgi:hypothetical protein